MLWSYARVIFTTFILYLVIRLGLFRFFYLGIARLNRAYGGLPRRFGPLAYPPRRQREYRDEFPYLRVYHVFLRSFFRKKLYDI
jgi:hypothetical protein